MSPSSPIDLMMINLAPQMGVGQRLRLETIQERLRKLPLGATLDLLAQIAYRADSTMSSQADRAELAEQLFAGAVGQRAGAMIRAAQNLAAVSSHDVVTVAVQALVHCPDDAVAPHPDRHARELGALILACAGLAERKGLNDNELLLELVRLELWFRLADLDRWYEVCHRLVIEILPTLHSDVDWVDVTQLVEAASALTLERFMSLTFAMGVVGLTTPGQHMFPQYLKDDTVPRADIDAWARVWTIPLAEARSKALVDADDSNGWSFSCFFDRPILEIAPGRSVVIRPWFLAIKGTPTGFYNLVERLLAERRGDTLRWSRLFGRAVEALGRRFAVEHLAGTEIIGDENEVRRRWGPGKACDTVILGDMWVAVDFVHRRISRATATAGTVTDLARDLSIGVVDKLEQIDATITRALATEIAQPVAVYPVVVVGAPFPTNGLVMNEVDRLLETRTPTAIGIDPRCQPPVVMDLGEYWTLLETAQAQGLHPSDLLGNWISGPLALTSFRNWLVTHGPGQAGAPTARRHWARTCEELFVRPT